MAFQQRTIECGRVNKDHVGEQVTVNGWAHKVRDLGGLIFVDLRDRTGLVQCVFDPDDVQDAEAIRSEFCLAITGTVRMRDEKNRNPRLATGDVEVVASAFDVLSAAKTLPFPVSDEEQMEKVNEELRVKYRYLDLRRPSMYEKLAVRASAVRRIREHLDQRGFMEIETPIFTRSTPEGARDYLVPYRLEPGKFYALPQSPQQYKQLLMVAGVERYYQIAKCFRDEAQRADRQPEFTQLDLEMSFVTQEDVLTLIEGLTIEVVNGLIDEFDIPKDKVSSFVRMTYDEAMEKFASDKPDLRFSLEVFDVSDAVKDSGFGVFANAVASGGKVRGLRYPGGSSLSRKEVGEIEEACKSWGAKGMASLYVEPKPSEGSIPVDGKHVRGSIAKFFSHEELAAILTRARAEAGDLLCFIADSWKAGNEVLGRLRNLIGTKADLRDPRRLSFVFVLDFPLVEWNEEESRWDPTHHPFTSPKAADLEFLESDPARVRADCYDVVCNGVEWASGSIRIHRPDVQRRCFSLIGVDERQQKERFGHIIEAFEFGAPPHGGIAPGIDRLIMFLLDEENIREVIAFPKVGGGYDPLMRTPWVIDLRQLQELGLNPPRRPDHEIAESVVARLLKAALPDNDHQYDLVTPSGVRVEVKSGAAKGAHQGYKRANSTSWRLHRIDTSIVYVFCMFDTVLYTPIQATDPNSWHYYVVGGRQLSLYVRKQLQRNESSSNLTTRRILLTLRGVRHLAGDRTEPSGLSARVHEVASTME